ncbi:3-phosphoglycerate dehydrogenase [Lewinellaceae bacterium SD302]|nr:3-phosphoglycerate dehydrogenase [Lewinellaceae bacterium SD302]
MIRILANDGIAEDGKTLLEEAGYEVVTEKVAQEDLATELPNYDAIIVRSATKVRKELIDQCPRLQVIARAGVGLDNIDHDYARSIGRTVVNTPAASSQAVAELVFTHFFSLARFVHQSNRQLPAADSDFKALKKSYSKGVQLRGKTLGIIGFGRIGVEAARIGLALGMKIMPVDLHVESRELEIDLHAAPDVKLKVTVETVEMEEMITAADFITIHVPSLKGALIGAEELKKMKNSAIIVNTARGGVIDEEALIAALDAGEIAGAGLDVFINEPTPDRHLLEHPRLSVSPHIGASTQEAQRNIGLELADQILAHFGA